MSTSFPAQIGVVVERALSGGVLAGDGLGVGVARTSLAHVAAVGPGDVVVAEIADEIARWTVAHDAPLCLLFT